MESHRFTVPLLIVAAALLSGCSDSEGMKPGRPVQPLPVVTNPLPTDVVDTASAYDIVIHRNAAPALEAYLIAAENVPPKSGGPWWFTAFDGIRVAGTVTQEAVQYYIDRTGAFQAGDFSGTIPMIGSSLRYDATIEFRGTYQVGGRTYHRVYVATMSLSWFGVCGDLCGMGFDRTRTVILNVYGEPLKTLGDDTLIFWVS